jgi:hypothetical protein
VEEVMKTAIWPAVVLLWSVMGINSYAQERFYMIIFGSQTEPNLPRSAHTFAVFIKTSGAGKDHTRHKVETHCISWLPKTLTVEPLRLRPEPGVNLDLPQSLKYAASEGAQVAMWGPFRIQEKAYDLALKRIELLQSGKMAYIAMDRRFRGTAVTNCIHAVSDLDTEQPLLLTGTAHGDAASLQVLQHLERWIVKENEDNNWLLDRLGLAKEKFRLVKADRK